jgi:formate hydrogenlyase transcriptional activator
VKVDVRVIAATNRDLQVDADQKRFRADLYYRLNVFPIELPPLRERPDDVETLAHHFMRRMARKLGKPLGRIDPRTLDRLKQHSWPGNIRDLQNTIERAAILATDDTLVIDWDLGPAPRPAATPVATVTTPSHPTNGTLHPPSNGNNAASGDMTLEAIERQHIIGVLRRTRGVIEGPDGAARLLNLKPSTARFRMKRLGITRSDYL